MTLSKIPNKKKESPQINIHGGFLKLRLVKSSSVGWRTSGANLILKHFSLWHFIKFNKQLMVLGCFILIVLLFFWKFILQGLVPVPGDILLGTYFPWLNDKWGTITGVRVKNSLMSDVVSLTYPWRYTVIDYLKHGQFPLWDPASFLGESLVGNFQAGIFNPFNLIFLLPLTFSINWGIMVMVQPLLAMTCMYILLKHWKLSPFPAILGSVAYGLSAQMIIWMEYNIHGFSIATFPLAIFFIDYYLDSKKIKYLLFYSLLVAFVIFVGYPQYLYYYILFSFLWLIIIKFYRSRSILTTLVQCMLLGLAILLGLGISSVQLLPGYESLQSSVRDVDTVALQNNTAFLPMQQIIMGIIPDYFGNPTTQNYWGQGYYESFAFYTSLVSITLMFWSLFSRKNRLIALILGIFGIVSLILSIDTPLSQSIESLKVIGLRGSVSTRVLFVFSFAISALSGLGMDNLLSSLKNRESFKIKPWLSNSMSYLGPIIFFEMVGLTVLELWFERHYIPTSKFDAAFTKTHLNNLIIALHNCIWPGLVVIGTSIVIVVARRFRTNWLLYLLLPLLVVDMFRFGWKYLPFTPYNQVFPKTPSLEFLMKQPQPFRVAIEPAEILTANTWEPYGLESPSGYDILVPHHTADYLSYINYSKVGQASVRDINIINFNSKLLSLANIKFVATILRIKGVSDPKGDIVYYLKTPQYQPVFQDGAVDILENKQNLNRFYSVSNYQVIPDEAQALAMINSKQFNDVNEIILNQDPHLTKLESCPVKLLTYNKESFHFSADCQAQSMLFISDAYHPGWKASVDGMAATVYKADAEFMAISLPAGKSDIKLNFFPDSFRIGLWISLISTGLLIGLLFLSKHLSIKL